MDLLLKYTPLLEKLSQEKKVLSIVIFGSYVNNKTTSLSDLDVAFLFDATATSKKRDEILSNATEELDCVDFSQLPLSLQYKILTQGQVFHSKIDLISLRSKVANQWFDFRPTLYNLYKKRGYPLTI